MESNRIGGKTQQSEGEACFLISWQANKSTNVEKGGLDKLIKLTARFSDNPSVLQEGFTHRVRAHFLEDVLEITGYKLTSFNQIADYGQEKVCKTQKQLVPKKKKKKNQITSLVEDTLKKASFENYSSRARDLLSCWSPDCIGFNFIEVVLCHRCRKERPGAVLVFMTGWEDISCLAPISGWKVYPGCLCLTGSPCESEPC